MGSNEITGDRIRSKNEDAESRKRFEEGFDRIFGKKKVRPPTGYTEEELERDNPYNQWIYDK